MNNTPQGEVPAHDDHPSAKKRIKIGPNMRKMWDYVNKHPGTLDYIVRIQFGPSGKKTMKRLVELELIFIEDNRCYVNQENDLIVTAAAARKRWNQVKAVAHQRGRAVACPVSTCKAPVGEPCTGLTYRGTPRIGPHYERLAMLAHDQEDKIRDLEAKLNNLPPAIV